MKMLGKACLVNEWILMKNRTMQSFLTTSLSSLQVAYQELICCLPHLDLSFKDQWLFRDPPLFYPGSFVARVESGQNPLKYTCHHQRVRSAQLIVVVAIATILYLKSSSAFESITLHNALEYELDICHHAARAHQLHGIRRVPLEIGSSPVFNARRNAATRMHHHEKENRQVVMLLCIRRYLLTPQDTDRSLHPHTNELFTLRIIDVRRY